MDPVNRAVLSFLTDAVAGSQKLSTTELQEFDGCRYLLSAPKTDETIVLAFSSSVELCKESRGAVWDEFNEVAEAGCTEDYQISLKVSISKLQELNEASRIDYLRRLASIRLLFTGFKLRQLMRALASSAAVKKANGGSGPYSIFSRPGAPFFVMSCPDSLTVLMPIWIKGRQDDLLTLAFAQEFSEARRAPGMSDAPQCHFTHPGQPPPMQLSHEQTLLLDTFRGGLLTMVVEPRHCSTPKAVERLVWMLLTFYSYLDLQVKSFKSLIHSRMRQNANQLLASMEASRAIPRSSKGIV